MTTHLVPVPVHLLLQRATLLQRPIGRVVRQSTIINKMVFGVCVEGKEWEGIGVRSTAVKNGERHLYGPFYACS